LVHGELIKAGRVVPLSYKQVRALERIDLKKSKSQSELELLNSTVRGSFDTLAGFAQGTVTGPILLVLLLSSVYPLWLPIVRAALMNMVDGIREAWTVTGATGAPPPPGLNNFDGGSGNFGVHSEPQLWVTIVESLGGIPTAGGTQWYETEAERDKAYNVNVNDSTVNWYWAFCKVNR
jgi:hypothetical protein